MRTLDDVEGTRLAGNPLETKRRKQRSFYFRTGAVVRTTVDNGRDVTVQCQVGGHVDCKKILIMPNRGTQVVQSHFLKCHTELNVMIRGLQNTVGADQDPPHFLKLLTTEKAHTVAAYGVAQNLLSSMQRGSKLLTGCPLSKGKPSFKRTRKSNRCPTTQTL